MLRFNKQKMQKQATKQAQQAVQAQSQSMHKASNGLADAAIQGSIFLCEYRKIFEKRVNIIQENIVKYYILYLNLLYSFFHWIFDSEYIR